MPGQPLNTNSLRHGKRTDRFGLRLARGRKRDRALHGDLLKFRRGIEAHLRKTQGTEALEDIQLADDVNQVCRFEEIAKRCEARLVEADLSPSEFLDFHKTIGWATQQRNAYIHRLFGNGESVDAWSAWEARRGQGDGKAPESIPSQEHAPEGDTGDEKGQS
ncbi:MAG: hypothetical protein ACYTG0_37685 [Planctomycetota bacterium]|jgi:hypothetical protein